MSEEQIFEKVCNGPCGRTLPITRFPKRYGGYSRDGYRGQCKDCRRAQCEGRQARSDFYIEQVEKTCAQCKGKPQPIENFHRNKNRKDGRCSVCKKCSSAKHLAYYQDNSEALRAKSKKWAEDNPGKVLARAVEWVKNNPEKSRATKKRWKVKTGYDTSDHARKLANARNRRHRRKAVAAMGGQCECCGISIFEFICFDHIGGWGVEHRKVVGQTMLPLWLKKHGYPKGDGTTCECGEVHKGIRLLCYSCNMSVAADPDGICAHKRTEPIDYSRFSDRSAYERQWRIKVRNEVFTEYGGRCQCPGCDETNFAFLSVEHVGGWGREHRAELKGTPMIQWLKRNGYPKDGITLRCFNCNMSAGKSESGKCPHELNVAKAA